MPVPPRLMEISTPLGNDVLLMRSMSATESLGQLYEFNISALSDDKTIAVNDLLGKPITVKLELADGGEREFSGIVTRFGQVGFVGRLVEYQLVVCPWLWLLTRTHDCRVFQNKSVPDILKQIFEKYSSDFSDKLTGSHPVREYCVQYRESDFNFVSRLMEEEGIYYYFEHKDGKHTLVLANKDSAHTPYPGHADMVYRETLSGGIDLEAITRWQFNHEIRTGKVSLTDYNFTTPSTNLLASAELARSHSHATGEVYDYPGRHLVKADGERYANLKLEGFQSLHAQVFGEGNVRGLATGHRFTLNEFPREDQNREHIVTSTRIQMGYGEYEGQSGSAPYFTCQFTALDSREVFRSPDRAVRVRVAGPQTAIVVGPSGDEIHTDEYGRVKIQFYWDREGKKNENSSCWVRVSSPWAGKNWGMINIPRIGQEVVVDFLEGDPDQPLITGRVYNAEQTVPYKLPDHATVSTLKSQSSKGGSTSTSNELRFEDKKGSEHVWLQAEKDFLRNVKNDSSHSVGHDEFVTIKNDLTEKVGNDHQLDVGKDFKHKVGGDMHLQTATDLMIKSGGQYSLKSAKDLAGEAGTGVSFKAGTDVHIKGGMNITLEAGMMLTLKAGGSSIVLGPAGVSIVGAPLVNINSGGGGSGAQPVAPAAPADPAAPKDFADPLAS
ncbi:MAG: type VI secretion system tip protein VgrG [Leptothrix sp. (in: Bacteria)]|nr:type VI secretion system tip protein VgrG [Leptothrix sp. (in: b-proteobacteria)]